MSEPRVVTQSWWEIALGGALVALATFGLLWAVAILGWALEGPQG